MRTHRRKPRTGLVAAAATATAAATAALLIPGATAGEPAPAAASPVGFGAGATGGAGGETVRVSDAAAFTEAVQGDGPRVVEVDGTVELDGMTKVASDKTIVGVGTSGRISGGGLNISEVGNVVVRNMTISGSDDDNINVQYATDVWLDHNTLTDAGDGNLDIKRASDGITVSWNHFHGQDKNALLGHSDDNGDEDADALHVTYAFNWFDGTNQRNPRVRFGNPVHVLNNYYDDIGSYGVASTEDAGVLIEGNYFENTEDPFHLGEGDSGPGTIEARDNHFASSGTGEAGGSVADIPYDYDVQPAEGVKAAVTEGAGVGNL
ncbi:pectate lyase family protein [Streptomyces sp. MAR4 CNX-425]|uniref:pectate lyase family protein n=1 Tax=Streptomyces sp. MAR4 CNX-425 TaxID=3406343 RepID=UPI003B50B6C9